ncbi:hypothetical protein CBR_g24050 [Chara braunii]|uniref:C2 domain-containing protein n=1 Tax=Chara braunii TaxID=69332 RepID=A0A388L5W7_CHABU|nr:hypothetical protein CBR_g24050 [Chara braunii]|eukprot:GBG77603.1 hypothetical protein CBR_g24050 [Chara braunii]
MGDPYSSPVDVPARETGRRPAVGSRGGLLGCWDMACDLASEIGIGMPEVQWMPSSPTAGWVINKLSHLAHQLPHWPMLVHLAFAIVMIWLAGFYRFNLPFVATWAIIYLWRVDRCQRARAAAKVRAEERRRFYQKMPMEESETVVWLNVLMSRIWPMFLRDLVQDAVLPVMPFFLERFKPWTLRKAVLKSLKLGSSPPVVLQMRVFEEPNEDDHAVVEMVVEFLAADDMVAELQARVRKRVGLGVWATAYASDLHLEGKVLVGLKFLPGFPFIERMRVCFVERPNLDVSVKPLVNAGVDVTEIPGISTYVDSIIDTLFSQALVKPNMVVVDVKKLLARKFGNLFPELQPLSDDLGIRLEQAEPVAFAIVEVLKAESLTPADSNGLSDVFVKGAVGTARFETSVKKKTTDPEWLEEFRVPIFSWKTPNRLIFRVRDKELLRSSKSLGYAAVDLSELRDGLRHDMWLTLKNVNRGRLLVAITIQDHLGKPERPPSEESEESSDEAMEESGTYVKERESSWDNDKGCKQEKVEGDAVGSLWEGIDIGIGDQNLVRVEHPGRAPPAREYEARVWQGRDKEGKEAKAIETEERSDELALAESLEEEDQKHGLHRDKLKTKLKGVFNKLTGKGGKKEWDRKSPVTYMGPNIEHMRDSSDSREGTDDAFNEDSFISMGVLERDSENWDSVKSEVQAGVTDHDDTRSDAAKGKKSGYRKGKMKSMMKGLLKDVKAGVSQAVILNSRSKTSTDAEQRHGNRDDRRANITTTGDKDGPFLKPSPCMKDAHSFQHPFGRHTGSSPSSYPPPPRPSPIEGNLVNPAVMNKAYPDENAVMNKVYPDENMSVSAVDLIGRFDSVGVTAGQGTTVRERKTTGVSPSGTRGTSWEPLSVSPGKEMKAREGDSGTRDAGPPGASSSWDRLVEAEVDRLSLASEGEASDSRPVVPKIIKVSGHMEEKGDQ